MSFDTEARQRAATSAALIVGGMVAAFLIIRNQLFDPRDLMTYDRTEGPFAVTVNQGAHEIGSVVRDVHRGETIAWITTLCVAPGVMLSAQLRLVQVADRRTIVYRDHTYPPNTRPCGPQVVEMQVPPDAPAGSYDLERTLLLTPPTGSPRSEQTPPIAFEVLP